MPTAKIFTCSQPLIMISIILPTYNEAQNIIPLIQAIDREVTLPHEIIVVDDKSADGTSEIVASFIKKHKSKYIRLETRRRDHGLTKSIRHGIDKARGGVFVWMDCDFSHPPSILPLLISKITHGYDIAVGSRYVPAGQPKRLAKDSGESMSVIILSKMLNKLCMALFGNDFHDYTSGFVSVSKTVVDNIRLRGDYGEYFIDFIVRAKRQGYKIAEIPFVNASRLYGESKTGGSLTLLFKRGLKYITVVILLLLKNDK